MADTYKGWTISPALGPGWQALHPDYEGDPRDGFIADTREELVELIDEREADHG